MVNDTRISSTSLMETLNLQREMAKGAISIKPNFADNEMAIGSFSDLMKAVDSGKSDDLVGAMVASQKASLSFSAMIQIRNRLVQAFDDVIKMPV
jgi:flagellar hook-basal body complex protein FliE